jgi:hypothetical protein
MERPPGKQRLQQPQCFEEIVGGGMLGGVEFRSRQDLPWFRVKVWVLIVYKMVRVK